MGIIIALSVVLIIAVVLFSSLHFKIKISDTVVFSVRFLGFKLFTIDQNKAPVTKNNKHKSGSKKTGKNKFTNTIKEYAKGKTKKELIIASLDFIKSLCAKLGSLLKHVKFKRLEFNLIVASSDAATTAILYGNLCSVVYSICAALSSAYNFDVKKINVSADFSTENMQLKLDTCFKIKLVFVICFLLKAAFSIIKLRMGEVKNGRA